MGIKKYDVFVIGSGVAGQTVAKECVKAGLKVAIADKREYGGVCANQGCDPKKVILGITEAIKFSSDLLGKGIATLPKASWKESMKFKEFFTDAVPASTEKNLKKLGIAMYHQSPRFLDKNTLSVEGKTVVADKIVIASGLIPRPLEIEGGTLALLSDDFLNLEVLPESMIFIGAGYIGMEFAQMAARFGVSVTVIDMGERPLSIFDEDMVSYITKASIEIGIKFIFNAEIKAIEELRKNKRVHFSINGQEDSIKAELIFNTSGRIPSLKDLDLEKGNVSYSHKGIKVNEFLQNPDHHDVYACGDISDNALPLTPFSGREGKIVAHNLLHGNEQKADFPITPSVAFTLPHIASIGLSEKEAKDAYVDLKITNKDASGFYNAKRLNEKVYAYKTIVDNVSGRIIGAHLVGPEAGEVINLFAMAIHKKMTVTELKDMIFTYPSFGSDIQGMF